MIYLLNSGPGRFGNRLFSANYIFQLKEIFEADIFIGGSNDLNKHFVFNFNNEKNAEIKIGFRFIFQSKDKTLTDDEVDEVIENIKNTILSINWAIFIPEGLISNS